MGRLKNSREGVTLRKILKMKKHKNAHPVVGVVVQQWHSLAGCPGRIRDGIVSGLLPILQQRSSESPVKSLQMPQDKKYTV